MRLNNTIKFSFTLSAVTVLLVTLFVPSVLSASDYGTTYYDDGIWIDTFTDKNSTIFIKGTSECIWENEAILLKRTATAGRDYTFLDGGSFDKNDHKAYYYSSFRFPQNIFNFLLNFRFSPSRIISGAADEFDKEFLYPAIEQQNEPSNQYAITVATGLHNVAVQHFRFKLDGSAKSIGELELNWFGKAENAKSIEMYYWTYSNLPLMNSFLNRWTVVNKTETIDDVVFRSTLDSTEVKKALGSKNYIDICVVATAAGSPCKLYTDYVKVHSTQQEGFKIGYALVQTKDPVSLPVSTDYWDFLAWDDYQRGSATVRFQILRFDGTKYVPVSNSVLPGNEQGFTTSPVSLTSLSNSYTHLKIQANLTTKDPSVSPRVYSWTLGWQKQNQWQDRFRTEYRVDENKNLQFFNGTINISLASGDWLMFGQNPQNTRASPGKAARMADLYWYSDYPELSGQTPSNPIVDGESLYFAAVDQDNKGYLYRYHSIIISESQYAKNFPNTIRTFNIPDQKPILGSPAVSGEYLIVATGELESKNFVYVYKKNNPPNVVKTFDYGDNICYSGSPVVADGMVYLTGWSGQPTIEGYHTNNKLLAFTLDSQGNLNLKWNYTFPYLGLGYRSPTWSFSTPAVSDGTVIVGNMNSYGDSLFALDATNGGLLWNISIGAIGSASPVISNGVVYVISEQPMREDRLLNVFRSAQVNAIDINDGTVLWEFPLTSIVYTHPLDLTYCLAQSTPAVVDNVLYVTSPVGTVFALDLLQNGKELWNKGIYSKMLPASPLLTSSPAYADGILYVGTPTGKFYALNTTANGSEVWQRSTFPFNQGLSVVTDPIVVNGIVFFAGANGRIYASGRYVKPTDQISGSIISAPINLPEGYWWKKFHAQVQTAADSTINKIIFSLLDEQNNVIKTLVNNSNILVENRTLDRTLRLRADFWAKNSSVNPNLIFWNITFLKDFSPPFLNLSTLTPHPQGYLTEVVPVFTIKVKDNDTGLLVSSAVYTLEYEVANQTHKETYKAVCTGVNGTTSWEMITIDLSKLSFYANITALRSLTINITDLAGNTASRFIRIKQDTQKPVSFIRPQNIKPMYNATSSFIWINASSYDNGTDASGVKLVKLYYRHSLTGNFSGVDWVYYANSTQRFPSWKFNFTSSSTQRGGYFELCTVATDYAGNVEDYPAKGDVSFIYDWTAPELPSISGETFWFKQRPSFTVRFSDDFRLHTIQYRPNFDTTWTTIASQINASTYNAPWSLKQEYWEQMEEGERYYLYFRINDTVGNTLLVTSNEKAVIIRKDTKVPVVTIDILERETEYIWGDNFTVSALIQDEGISGIQSVVLFYRFSLDKSNWTNWTAYGETLFSSPYEWKFNAVEGDGHYEFKIQVTDKAGNQAESEVISSAISSFPTALVIIMIALVVVLLLISVFIFFKWKKRE